MTTKGFTRTAPALVGLALVFACAFAGISAYAAAQATTETLPLWLGQAPGLEAFGHKGPEVVSRDDQGRVRGISAVSTPTLTILPAAERSTSGTTVVVFPGGGYRQVVIGKEGYDVAERLNSLGITAVVVKYRTRPEDFAFESDRKRGERIFRAITEDGLRAVRIVRGRAAEWGGDPNKIGVMGFSAGGRLAMSVAVHSDSGRNEASDPVERTSSRPDFVCLAYPSVDDELLCGDLPPGLPPTFVVETADDSKTYAWKCLDLYRALIESGALAELHLFQQGEHGFGIGIRGGAVKEWTALFETWLEENHLLVENRSPAGR